MNRWSTRSSCSLLATLLFSASPVMAQEAGISISDTPTISVVETKPASQMAIGLLTAEQVNLPADLWGSVSHDEVALLLQNVTGGVESSAIRNLVIRALLLQSEMPDGKRDLIAERVETLIRLGQPIAAEKILQVVPASFQKPRQKQLQFLFTLLHATKKQEDICNDVTTALAEKSSPFWQRWMVLCQAKSGETDKAQLGIDLLGEQSQYSEFYQKIVQGLLTKKPPVKLPDVIYLEQASWLFFTGDKKYLSSLKNPPLAYAALYPDQWPALAKKFGLRSGTPALPRVEAFTPSLAYLKIPQENATPKDKQLAFLAYSIRKAFKQPVSLEIEQELSVQSYETPQIVMSPTWRESLKSAAENKELAKVILLLASGLSHSLNEYSASDITFAVTTLKQAGLPADAYALAQEAIEKARSL